MYSDFVLPDLHVFGGNVVVDSFCRSYTSRSGAIAMRSAHAYSTVKPTPSYFYNIDTF